MRAVIQRVSTASVTITGNEHAAIGQGLMVLLGVGPDDNQDDVVWLAGKIARLRIFADETGKMNRSVADINGECLVVSQFTLFAATEKGNRPAFTGAASPTIAIPLYEAFVAALARDSNRPVKTGEFGADMQVSLTNDGPVTIVIDSQRRE